MSFSLFFRNKVQPGKLKYQDCFSNQPITDDFASTVLNSTLELLNQVLGFWSNLPSSLEIVHRLRTEFIPKLESVQLHKIIRQNLNKIKSTLEEKFPSGVVRSHTIPKRKKEIQMLRLYDPDLEEK